MLKKLCCLLVLIVFCCQYSFSYSDTFGRGAQTYKIWEYTFVVKTDHNSSGYCGAGLLSLDGKIIFHSDDFMDWKNWLIPCVLGVQKTPDPNIANIYLCYSHGAGSGECIFVVVRYYIKEWRRWTPFAQWYFTSSKRFTEEPINSITEEEIQRKCFGYYEDKKLCPFEIMLDKLKTYQVQDNEVYERMGKNIDRIWDNMYPHIQNKPIVFLRVLEKYVRILDSALASVEKNTTFSEKEEIVMGIQKRLQILIQKKSE